MNTDSVSLNRVPNSAAANLFGRGATEAAESGVTDATDEAATEAESAGARSESEASGCSGPPHSFTGATRVLMADGTSKAIDRVKVGDTVADSVPGLAGTQAHKVTAVIVTKTDHDFVDLTVRKVSGGGAGQGGTAAAEAGSAKPGSVRAGSAAVLGAVGRKAARRAALGLAASAAVLGVLGASHDGGHAGDRTAVTAAVVAPAVQGGAAAVDDGARVADGHLATTFHHPFYDETRAAFVEAADLHPGAVLQTPTGAAQVTGVRLYHAHTTTYDLTIGTLHTYYVEAGATPVLVHNTNVSCRTPAGQPGAGRFAPDPNRLRAGQLDSNGMLRGTNETGQVTSRGSFRVATEDNAWDNAEVGPGGGRMCPTQGPNCTGEVMVAPRTSGVTRDWDVSHNPSWTNRQFDPGVSREEVLDEYQKGTGLECIPCNRSGGNDDSRFG